MCHCCKGKSTIVLTINNTYKIELCYKCYLLYKKYSKQIKEGR